MSHGGLMMTVLDLVLLYLTSDFSGAQIGVL